MGLIPDRGTYKRQPIDPLSLKSVNIYPSVRIKKSFKYTYRKNAPLVSTIVNGMSYLVIVKFLILEKYHEILLILYWMLIPNQEGESKLSL